MVNRDRNDEDLLLNVKTINIRRASSWYSNKVFSIALISLFLQGVCKHSYCVCKKVAGLVEGKGYWLKTAKTTPSSANKRS